MGAVFTTFPLEGLKSLALQSGLEYSWCPASNSLQVQQFVQLPKLLFFFHSEPKPLYTVPEWHKPMLRQWHSKLKGSNTCCVPLEFNKGLIFARTVRPAADRSGRISPASHELRRRPCWPAWVIAACSPRKSPSWYAKQPHQSLKDSVALECHSPDKDL